MSIPDWMIDTPSATVDDLATLALRLVRELRKAAPGNVLSDQTVDYLTRHGMLGSPLRAVAPAPSQDAPTGDVWLKHDDDLRFVARVLSGGLKAPQDDIKAAQAIVHELRTTARNQYGQASLGA